VVAELLGGAVVHAQDDCGDIFQAGWSGRPTEARVIRAGLIQDPSMCDAIDGYDEYFDDYETDDPYDGGFTDYVSVSATVNSESVGYDVNYDFDIDGYAFSNDVPLEDAATVHDDVDASSSCDDATKTFLGIPCDQLKNIAKEINKRALKSSATAAASGYTDCLIANSGMGPRAFGVCVRAALRSASVGYGQATAALWAQKWWACDKGSHFLAEPSRLRVVGSSLGSTWLRKSEQEVVIGD
jgi:hypothetical protein